MKEDDGPEIEATATECGAEEALSKQAESYPRAFFLLWERAEHLESMKAWLSSLEAVRITLPAEVFACIVQALPEVVKTPAPPGHKRPSFPLKRMPNSFKTFCFFGFQFCVFCGEQYSY